MRIVISYLKVCADHLRIVGFAFGLSLTRLKAQLWFYLGGSLTFRKEPPD